MVTKPATVVKPLEENYAPYAPVKPVVEVALHNK